jgi:hypothetical protein
LPDVDFGHFCCSFTFMGRLARKGRPVLARNFTASSKRSCLVVVAPGFGTPAESAGYSTLGAGNDISFRSFDDASI